jgi:cytochrome P450 family 135
MNGSRRQSSRVPPRIRTPSAWQSLQYLIAPTQYLARAQQRHGDIFTARLLGQDWVVLADPSVIREVFAKPPDQMLGGEPSRVLEPLIGTRNTLMFDGDEYLQRRRLLLPSFHGEALARHDQAINDAAQSEIATWPANGSIAVLPHMQRLSATIIKRCVLGETGDVLAGAVVDLLTWLTGTSRLAYYFAFGAKRLMQLPGYQQRQRRIDQEMQHEINRRRHNATSEKQNDVLSMLVNAVDENGDPLSDRDIRDEAITLLVAGHENTAATLAWAAHELARAPLAQQQFAEHPDTWSAAVIAETLRLRPPVPIVPRRLASTCDLAGYRFEAGTNVAPCALLAQRQASLYPNPLRFDPTRFLDHRPGRGWLAFGGGARRCIGDAFAQLELRLILAAIVGAYRLEPAGPPERARPRALVLVPGGGAQLNVSRRA